MFKLINVFKKNEELKRKNEKLMRRLEDSQKMSFVYAGLYQAYSQTLMRMFMDDKITADQYCEFLRIENGYFDAWRAK